MPAQFWLFVPGCGILAKMAEYMNENPVVFLVGHTYREARTSSQKQKALRKSNKRWLLLDSRSDENYRRLNTFRMMSQWALSALKFLFLWLGVTTLLRYPTYLEVHLA